MQTSIVHPVEEQRQGDAVPGIVAPAPGIVDDVLLRPPQQRGHVLGRDEQL